MDLLILAAGMGSRFGGLKQIEPFDDRKNFIIDYSIYDAKKAGFDRVVFLIKEENREIFESTVGKRVEKYIEVAYAYQKLDVVPEGSSTPMTSMATMPSASPPTISVPSPKEPRANTLTSATSPPTR